MPVYKYRSFEEAEKALWCLEPDEEYYRNASRLWEIADIIPHTCPKGIFKFRTIEEANKHRTDIEHKNALNLRNQRDSKKI